MCQYIIPGGIRSIIGIHTHMLPLNSMQVYYTKAMIVGNSTTDVIYCGLDFLY